MKIYSTDIQIETKKYINTFIPIYIHMYISNITYVNITNYLKISSKRCLFSKFEHLCGSLVSFKDMVPYVKLLGTCSE